MAYSTELGIAFWTEFDDQFKYDPPADVRQAYAAVFRGNFSRLLFRWRQHRRDGTYPAAFRAELLPARNAVLLLASRQVEVFNRYFAGDETAERLALEDFGQGVLFDGRRPDGDKVHMMDTGGPQNPPIGYHRWHAFARAVVLVGADAAGDALADRWLGINRGQALAWAIQSELRPSQDKPDNPPMRPDRLRALRERWTGMDAGQLDTAFDRSPYPPAA